jgi:UDP-glucose:(heptosyl)LPS alpha-1,3-glucosyltransferase
VNGWIENAPYRKGAVPQIVAISDMVKEDMIRWYRVQEDRVTVVYNGVDIEHFHPANRRYREEIRKKHGIGDEFVILFVSNNFRMKGLVFLMKALASLKKKCPTPFRLLILGRDRQEPYRRLASRIGLSGETIFAGSTDNPEKYYGAVDLLVHPSFYDACSLTVLEALASGLPVITTSTNGASGVLHQGEEGYVLSDPRDERDLEDKIYRFLEPDRRAQASKAARVLAEHYSEEKNWREMRAIFEKSIVEREAAA